jgi:hypothetical protein
MSLGLTGREKLLIQLQNERQEYWRGGNPLCQYAQWLFDALPYSAHVCNKGYFKKWNNARTAILTRGC